MTRTAEVARRLLAQRPYVLDAGVSLAVLAASLPPLVDAHHCGCGRSVTWGYLLVGLQCAALLARRRLPFVTALVVGILTAIYGISSLPDPAVPFAGMVATYSAAAHATRRLALVTAALTAVGIAASLLASGSDATAQDWSVNYLVFSTAWLLGDAARNRWEAARVLEARAEQLERTRAVEARRAVAEERNRIAREMHDVVAHHVSLMVVQAEAGPVVVRRDPDRASAAFDAISATGKQALTEMRRLLGVLRRDENATGADDARLAPQRGAADIGTAVEAMRAAGLTIESTETGVPRPLPPGVDLSAFRIVQEALTNVLKHAGPARTCVRVHYDDDAVTVEIVDDGLGGRDTGVGTRSSEGNGLIGMQERVALVGGELEAGPAPTGGWRVRARLPLEPVRSP